MEGPLEPTRRGSPSWQKSWRAKKHTWRANAQGQRPSDRRPSFGAMTFHSFRLPGAEHAMPRQQGVGGKGARVKRRH